MSRLLIISERDIPPPAINWARVIAYAFVDANVQWTRQKNLYVDGQLLGKVPRIAICQNIFGSDKDILLFHCDTTWEVLGVSAAPTIKEMKIYAEKSYKGIGEKWVHSEKTESEVECWLRDEYSDYSCSFCNKLSVEVDWEIFFFDESPNICYECVRKLYTASNP